MPNAYMLTMASLILHANVIPLISVADDSVSPPNIVFLFADDQSTYSVGCYGNNDVQTPNMDLLARDGVVFDKHYNTTAICMASRASVFTGMYEYKTGCNFSHGDMREDVWAKSYPVLLRNAGYLTAFAGKFGIVVEGRGLCEDDFDFWGGGPGQTNYATAKNQSMQKYAEKYPHSTLSYGAFGQDVIREAVKQQRPFCLSISFKAPHKPATADPRFDEIYAGKSFKKTGQLRPQIWSTPFATEQDRSPVPSLLRLEVRHRLRRRDGKVPSAGLRNRCCRRDDS